jgi:hypothetical protein
MYVMHVFSGAEETGQKGLALQGFELPVGCTV